MEEKKHNIKGKFLLSVLVSFLLGVVVSGLITYLFLSDKTSQNDYDSEIEQDYNFVVKRTKDNEGCFDLYNIYQINNETEDLIIKDFKLCSIGYNVVEGKIPVIPYLFEDNGVYTDGETGRVISYKQADAGMGYESHIFVPHDNKFDTVELRYDINMFDPAYFLSVRSLNQNHELNSDNVQYLQILPYQPVTGSCEGVTFIASTFVQAGDKLQEIPIDEFEDENFCLNHINEEGIVEITYEDFEPARPDLDFSEFTFRFGHDKRIYFDPRDIEGSFGIGRI